MEIMWYDQKLPNKWMDPMGKIIWSVDYHIIYLFLWQNPFFIQSFRRQFCLDFGKKTQQKCRDIFENNNSLHIYNNIFTDSMHFYFSINVMLNQKQTLMLNIGLVSI